MPEQNFRAGLEGFPGHLAAARLISKHATFVGAWNEMEIFSLDQAGEWLGDPSLIAAEKRRLEDREDAIIQVAVQFAMVAVMADRERRREDEELQTRVRDSGKAD